MPGGRPTKYKPEYVEQARKLTELGATDVQLADFFEVDLSTISLWKVVHKEFSEALKMGKEIADDLVEKSLFQRATGYSHDAIKIVTSAGEIFREPYVEHYPPDTTAAIFWLKNRRPKDWRNDTQPIAQTPLAEIVAKDAPVLRPDEEIPANPVL